MADDPGMVEMLRAELRQARAENVALNRREAALTDELAEARARQAATTEILRLMSSNHADTQSVFDTVAVNAARLCGAMFAGVHLFDGALITLDAQHNIKPDEMDLLQRQVFPLPAKRESAVGRAVHDRQPTHIHDIRDDPNYRLPVLQSSSGFRTVLAVPMLRDGVPFGAISVWRRDVSPYSDRQIRLVEAFADQALLARHRPRPLEYRERFDALVPDDLLREIAGTHGDWEAAHEYLSTAERHARREGLTWELARILEARASILSRPGRGADVAVRLLLEEALHLYERQDDRRESARLRNRIEGLMTRGERGALPAGITRREAQVLRLVATGLSNHNIADTLGLSEKTVENHLTNIYAKIGADNRAAASAFAVRHGLA